MLELTMYYGGEKAYINPSRIVLIKPYDGGSSIRLAGSTYTVEIKEAPHIILARIKDATQ